MDVSGSLQPAGSGLPPKAPKVGGGGDALYPGPGCPAPGGGRAGDRPAARDRPASHLALEVAERWMPGASSGCGHEQQTKDPQQQQARE